MARWKEKWVDDRYDRIVHFRGRISNDKDFGYLPYSNIIPGYVRARAAGPDD